MKSILEELYHEKFYKNNLPYGRDTSQSRQSIQTGEIIKQFRQKMTEDEFKSLNKLLEIINEENALEISDTFRSGFRYGALIMMEILKDAEN